MGIPLHKLPGLQPLALRMETAEGHLGFIWEPEGTTPADVGVLRRQVPLHELAGFDNDLANLGRVYAAAFPDGSLHHFPLLYFTEPEGHA